MVEHSDNENILGARAVNDRERKAPHDDSAAVATDARKGKWHASCRLNRRIQCSRELKTETGDVSLLPCLGIQGFDLGLGAEKYAHQ